jgi:hypothetical protein
MCAPVPISPLNNSRDCSEPELVGEELVGEELVREAEGGTVSRLAIKPATVSRLAMKPATEATTSSTTIRTHMHVLEA